MLLAMTMSEARVAARVGYRAASPFPRHPGQPSERVRRAYL